MNLKVSGKLPQEGTLYYILFPFPAYNFPVKNSGMDGKHRDLLCMKKLKSFARHK